MDQTSDIPHSGESESIDDKSSFLERQNTLLPREQDILDSIDTGAPICLLQVAKA